MNLFTNGSPVNHNQSYDQNSLQNPTPNKHSVLYKYKII